MILFLLTFAFVIAICGTSSAATVHNNTTISHNNNSVDHTLKLTTTNAKKAGSKGDPIITGTVTINRYWTGTYYSLKGATITVNSTSGRILGTTTTDQNGNYYINFYSTDTKFLVTSSFLGCNSTTNTVTVTLNSTDGLYYGTSNFKMTPNIATLQSTGTGTNIRSGGGSSSDFAGVINVRINGVSYQAYCIDLYTNIATGNSLFVNGPLPGTIGDLNSQIDWGKVNYIIKNYSPSTDNEAAAMQCAIWYFTSVQYGAYPGNDSNHPGRYQFMTYSGDGLLTGGGTAVRTRALQMISAANSIQYPTNINLQPGTVRVPNGGSTTLTATVTDSNGNPMSGITVNFYTDKGTLSSATGTTNALGQISTILSGLSSSSATVYAMVNGTYGTLLYDNPSNPLQNLVAVNAVPYTFSDSSTVNFDVTANVQLSQTSTNPVNVGDNYQYVVKAHNYGPNAATGILISDVIPAGLTNYTVTPSVGTFSNGVWTIPTLANGGEATLTISGIAISSMAGTTNTNTATITGQDQYNSYLSTPSSADVYTKKSVLSITNSATNSKVNVGDNGKFTITVTNSGPDAASNIQISDVLPSGYTASWTTGSYSNNVWTITSLASGSSATLTFTGLITPSMAGKTTTNHATATWTEYPKTVTISDATIYVKDAEVALSQTTSGTNVNVGDTVTYTVKATNNGPDTATNINITDTIPNGLNNVIVTPSIGTYSNGIWTIPTLTNGQIATLTITGTASSSMAGTNTTNTATRTSQTEYNSQPTTTTSTPIYTKKADVKLSQTSTSPVNVGDVVQYVVKAVNNGPDTASNVNIKDLVPSQLIGVIATPSVGTFNNGVWTIPTLANGQTATLTITGTASSSMAGTNTTNTATRTSQTEYNSQPTTTTATVYTKIVNLNIINSANNGKLNVGQTGQFTVTITNSGPDDATNINVNDLLPSGFTATATTGLYDGTTWTINSLTSGSSATLTFTGLITPSMAGKTITNHATATWTEYPSTLLISDSTIYVKDAEVALSQTTSGTNVNVGDTVTYTVKATNNGPDTATNINITDTIPNGLNNVIVTPSIGTYSNGIWTIPTLTNGQIATLTITGTASSSMAGTNTTNTATRTSQTEYNSQPTTTTATVYTKKADLSIIQTSTSPVNVGNSGQFTITVTNKGPDTATNINVNDLLPSGFTATATTGLYDGTTWTINSLTSGSSATLTFTSVVTPSMAGKTTTNHATATWTEYPKTITISDATIYVKDAEVALSQTTSGTNINVGDTVTYTVKATNNGPDDATNINITDTIPNGLNNVIVTPSIGTYLNGIWTIPTLTNGQIATLTITGTASSSMAGTNTTNTATRTSQTEYNSQPTTTTSTPIYTKKADEIFNSSGSYSGNKVTIIVTVKNNGPDDATNIYIKDLIPSGMTGTIVTPSVGSYNATTGIWLISNLKNGKTATLTIIGTAVSGSSITNNATKINQTEYDSNSPENSMFNIYIPQVDLSVRHNPWYYDSAAGNYQYEYQSGNTPVFYVIVSNSAKYDDATNIVLNYTIGTGYNYRGYDTQGIGTATYDSTTRTLTWTIPYLPKGGNILLKIFTGCTTSGNMTTALTNNAYISSVDQYDVNATNNNATCALIIDQSSDIGVNQTYTKSTENGKQYVIYTITATNNGPDNATGVIVTDKLPTGLTYYQISLDGGITWITSDPSYNKTTGTWTIGNFGINDLAKILMIKAQITGTGTIKNSVTKTQNGLDWNSDNNQQTSIMTISGTYTPTADVYIVRHVPWYYDSAAGNYQYEYQSGNTPVFYVIVANSAKYDDATNIVLNYTIGTGYNYRGYDTQGIGTATYDSTTRTLTWTIPYLPKGGNILLKIFTGCTTSGNMTTALTNNAVISSMDQVDANSTNNNATCALIIDQSSDIGVNQTYTKSTENGKQYVIYTITATNNGPDNATGVIVTDKLPTGLTYYQISLDGGITWITSDPSYNKTTGTWTIGNFDTTDQSKTLMIKAQITGTGTIKNSVTKTQNGLDWNSDNNEYTTVFIQ